MGDKKSIIVTDLGFGDAGKGTIVDYLARQSKVSAVVRFNGGAQARHNVVTLDGRHHGFSQFGSGTFVPGVRTHLSRFVLFDPEQLLQEVKELVGVGCNNPLSRWTVDERSLVVTPYHRAVNMAREELRGNQRHGTCGHGIGEAMSHLLGFPDEVVRVDDLRHPERLVQKVMCIKERFQEEFFLGSSRNKALLSYYFSKVDIDYWVEMATTQHITNQIVSDGYLAELAREGDLIFEGAQGVLLDEWYGFHPHTTWSTTTSVNALELLDEIGYKGKVERLGVLRTYMTRHGQGPFVTESSTLSSLLHEPHNDARGWQGTFRHGWFDAVMARYALTVSDRVDSLAITHVDRLATLPELVMATAYRFRLGQLVGSVGATCHILSKDSGYVVVGGLSPKVELTDLSYQELLANLIRKAEPLYTKCDSIDQFLNMVEKELGTPISIISTGPTALDKSLR